MSNSDQPSRFFGFTVDSFAGLPGTPLQLGQSSAKESVMPHLTPVLMILGAFVLILGMVIYVRAQLENRSEEMAPYRHYFGTEDERDLLRQSSWYDCENPRNSKNPSERQNSLSRLQR